MTFQDIFKSSFLDNVTSVSVLDMVLTMALAFCLNVGAQRRDVHILSVNDMGGAYYKIKRIFGKKKG